MYIVGSMYMYMYSYIEYTCSPQSNSLTCGHVQSVPVYCKPPEYIEYFTQFGSSPDGEELPVNP